MCEASCLPRFSLNATGCPTMSRQMLCEESKMPSMCVPAGRSVRAGETSETSRTSGEFQAGRPPKREQEMGRKTVEK
jgi:hypothetical protein